MKIAAIICNIVLFVFTCFVLMTDGVSSEAAYIVFTLLLLLVPILSLVVISRSRKNAVMNIVAIICNIILLGFTCWAFVDQYSHPRESGFVAYAVFVVLTPILNLAAIFLYTKRSSNAEPAIGKK